MPNFTKIEEKFVDKQTYVDTDGRTDRHLRHFIRSTQKSRSKKAYHADLTKYSGNAIHTHLHCLQSTN